MVTARCWSAPAWPPGSPGPRQWGIALDGLLAAEAWAHRKNDLRAAGTPPRPPGWPKPPILRTWTCRWRGAPPRRRPVALGCHVRVPRRPGVRSAGRALLDGRIDERAAGQMAAALPAALPARQGRYRTRRVPLLVTVCQAVTWHAVGDPAAIAATLDGLLAIGKKRFAGEGHVLSWQVEPGGSGRMAGRAPAPGRDTRAARAAAVPGRGIPLHAGPLATAGLRPPYMHPARQRELLLPALLDE